MCTSQLQGRCAPLLPFMVVLRTCGALQRWQRLQLQGTYKSSSARAALAPEAKEGYGPPPQKLSGPQATPAPRRFAITRRATS